MLDSAGGGLSVNEPLMLPFSSAVNGCAGARTVLIVVCSLEGSGTWPLPFTHA